MRRRKFIQGIAAAFLAPSLAWARPELPKVAEPITRNAKYVQTFENTISISGDHTFDINEYMTRQLAQRAWEMKAEMEIELLRQR